MNEQENKHAYDFENVLNGLPEELKKRFLQIQNKEDLLLFVLACLTNNELNEPSELFYNGYADTLGTIANVKLAEILTKENNQ